MNWRKYWRKAFCTLLIVTAESQLVFDATHPRTRTSDPPRKRRARALAISATTSNVSNRFAAIARP